MPAILVFLAAVLSDSQLQAQSPADWPQYNYDNRGWRFNTAETSLSPDNVGQLELKWRYPPEGAAERIGSIHATPVVVDGFVYFGTDKVEPSFYKISPTGKLVWCYKIQSVMTKENEDPYALAGLDVTDGVWNSALVTDTSVYFGTFGGQIICLDRNDGHEVWKINTKKAPFPNAHKSNIVASSPILADGKLIVAGGGFEHSLPTTEGYTCCTGRGYVAAFEPANGRLLWKYDVGPEPKKLDPPIDLPDNEGGTFHFEYGPSTSSVWCTPSYDPHSQTIFFGTDTHNAPRQPTKDDQRLYNEYSSAVIAIGIDGHEKWVQQLVENDVWNNAIPGWDPQTGQYKDVTVGDTPKIYEITYRGRTREVVGVGCKNGSYYVLDRGDGRILYKTPTYTGPPDPKMRAVKATRILALPAMIGGLQTGCAFDGERVFTNGIDWPGLTLFTARQFNKYAPSGGRVTCIGPDTLAEFWRHERDQLDVPRADEPTKKIRTGDPVMSGVAIANGVVFFTTSVSNKLVALSAADGSTLKEIYLGPVLCGPSVSRGRVYVGTGTAIFEPWDEEQTAGEYFFQFPSRPTGVLYAFGLPGDETATGQDNSKQSTRRFTAIRAPTTQTKLPDRKPPIQQRPPASTAEDFRDFCQAFRGRWVGDVTWEADYPGFGKRGQRVTAYAEGAIVEDGNALMAKFYGGDGSGTWLVAYDAHAQRIKSLWVTSGGLVSHSILYRRDGIWVEETAASLPDGTQIQGHNTIAITDDGTKSTWTRNAVVAGEQMPEVQHIWRRVSQ